MRSREIKRHQARFNSIMNPTASIVELTKESGGLLLKIEPSKDVSVLFGHATHTEIRKISQHLQKEDRFVPPDTIQVINQNLIERFFLLYEVIDSEVFVIGLPITNTGNQINNLIPIGMLYLDESWCATQSNKYLENILGINESDLLNRGWLRYFDDASIQEIKLQLELNFDLIHPPSFKQKLISDLGREIYVEIQLTKDSYNSIEEEHGFILFVRDITEQTLMNNKITLAATHDKLTQVPNRYLLNDRLEDCLSRTSSRKEDWVCIFIDINDFKRLNDIKGHHFGDQVLVETAQKIKSVLGMRDFLCRTGGDEFILLKPVSMHMHDSQIESFVKKLHQALNVEPYDCDPDNTIFSSIGCVSLIQILYLDYKLLGFNSVDDLWLALSDHAMYQSKTLYPNGAYKIFNNDDINNICDDFSIALKLESSSIEQSIVTVFQPIYDHQKVVALECLTRFQGDLGQYNIEQLIQISKRNGKDRLLFKHLLASNVAAIKQLEAIAAIRDTQLNYQINIEPFMIENKHEAAALISLLNTLTIEKSRIFLELSERDIDMDNSDLVNLYKLRDEGYSLSLDDFGTGNSNFKRLMEFNFDQIKMDKCFLDDQKETSYKILKNISAMLKEINLNLLIEGVETQQHMTLCQDLDIPLRQGYFLAKPMPLDTVISHILMEERELND